MSGEYSPKINLETKQVGWISCEGFRPYGSLSDATAVGEWKEAIKRPRPPDPITGKRYVRVKNWAHNQLGDSGYDSDGGTFRTLYAPRQPAGERKEVARSAIKQMLAHSDGIHSGEWYLWSVMQHFPTEKDKRSFQFVAPMSIAVTKNGVSMHNSLMRKCFDRTVASNPFEHLKELYNLSTTEAFAKAKMEEKAVMLKECKTLSPS